MVSHISNTNYTMIATPKEASPQDLQAAVKVPAMVIMFIITLTFGSMPLRMKAFRENKMVLALANAFSGGLFLAVGILHLLPEAAENFDNYYKDQDQKLGLEDEEHFPWAFLITVLSFALILFIEKIATEHQHAHGAEIEAAKQSYVQNRSILSHREVKMENLSTPQCKKVISANSSKVNSANNFHDNTNNHSVSHDEKNNNNQNNKNNNLVLQTQADIEEQFNEDIIKETLNIHQQLARSVSQNNQQEVQEKETLNLTPYLLQLAVGVHALFEGIAIGIQTQWSTCLGISLAVIGHKWAEAMTLGISFRTANLPLRKATIMIAIQAFMNPLGVTLGWVMSNFGDLITGIFTSISVGTFVYIACMEVIVEEFALKRYKWLKFGLFLVAIGFVCCLWWFEQLAGGG